MFTIFLSSCKKEELTETPVNNDPILNMTLIEPPNNSTIISNSPEIKWAQYPDAVSYQAVLSADANFITTHYIDSTGDFLSIVIPAGLLQTNIYYYWKVRAVLGNSNFSKWSETRRFRMLLNPPAAPVLLSPANNSNGIPFLPLFDWENSFTAEIYRLQLSLNQNFSQLVLDSGNIPVSTLQAPYFILNTGTSYFWRVNASNSNGASTGDWSQIFQFTTVNGPHPSSISGRITFADNNFIQPINVYFIGVYKTDNWPPEGLTPDFLDSLTIKFINNVYFADYSINNIANGNYHVTVYTQTGSLVNVLKFKSVYGCDTNRVLFSNCALNSPGTVSIINGNGINNINMLSWADSTKNIF